MTDDPDLRGLDRLRERIAGLEQATAAVECSDDRMDAYLRGMRDAEALVAPDYEAEDDAAEEPEQELEPAPVRELRGVVVMADPGLPTLRNEPMPPLRNAPLPPHLREEQPPRVWTPERDAELLRLNAESVSPKAILAHLNAMPGIPIASVDALKKRRHTLRQAEPDSAAEPFDGCSAEDWAEAVEMRRAGKGGREICEEFGWELRRAGAICAALDRAIAEERAA